MHMRQSSLIGQAPAYLTDLCRPSLSVRSTRHLRSVEQGLLHVPFGRTSTMQNRASERRRNGEDEEEEQNGEVKQEVRL